MQNFGNSTSFCGHACEPASLESNISAKVDLTCFIEKSQEGSTKMRITYNKDLYMKSTIKNLSDTFIALAENIVDAASTQNVWNVKMISERTNCMLLEEFNSTYEKPLLRTVHHCITEAALQYPEVNFIHSYNIKSTNLVTGFQNMTASTKTPSVRYVELDTK